METILQVFFIKILCWLPSALIHDYEGSERYKINVLTLTHSVGLTELRFVAQQTSFLPTMSSRLAFFNFFLSEIMKDEQRAIRRIRKIANNLAVVSRINF